MSRLPSLLDQKPPRDHDVFGDRKYPAVEHGTYPVRKPAVQFGASIWFLNKLNAEPNLRDRNQADVEMMERLAGHKLDDLCFRLWPA